MIISSGITSDGIILSYDTLYDLDVLDGGSVNNTTVVDYGYMTVSSGGTANSTTVDSCGGMYVYSGGTAISTLVNASGDLGIYKNGLATHIIENGGYVYVASGAEASFASNTFRDLVLKWWSATVHSGTTANNTTLSGGSLYVYAGGEANSTIMYNYGELHVFSGGTVNNTIVHSGFISVYGNGQADRTTVNPGGYIYVSSGGTATQIIENGGYVEVMEGGTATLVPNTFSGVIGFINTATVHSCTIASDVVVCSSATLEIHGGTVSNAQVGGESSATIDVFWGVADGIELLQKGRMNVSSGGTANKVTVNFNGTLTISSGATATEVLEKGGYVFVEDGAEVTFLPNSISDLSIGNFESATAHSGTIVTGITIRGKGCGFSVYNGGVASDISVTGVLDWNIYIGYLDVNSGGLVTGVSINSYGSCIVSSGGTVSDIEINQKGKMNVFSGASVTGIVENGGYVNIEEGAIVSFLPHSISSIVLSGSEASATVHAGTVMTHATIDNGGRMYVFSDGKADEIVVMPGGGLTVASGGTATDIDWTPTEGSINIESGAYATFASQFSGIYYGSGKLIYHSETVDGMSAERGRTMYVMFGGVANNVPSVDGILEVWSGGVLNGATINAAGYWYEYGAIAVSSGGVANDIKVNAGHLIVSRGGTANDVTIEGGKSAGVFVLGGGIVNDVTVNDRNIDVYQNGEVNQATILRGAMNVFYGGVANGGTVGGNTGYWASLNISGGTANDIAVVNSGLIHVSEGGTMNRARVNQGGNLNVSSGGVAVDAVIHAEGRLTVLENGTLRGGTVNEQGYLIVKNGGKLTGRMTLKSGAVVSAESGGIVDFDLTRTTVDADVLINDLSLIQGTPTYTLTVDGQQKSGEYYLAKGASGFDQLITITSMTAEEEPVTLSVGQTVNYEGVDYTLNLKDGDSLELFVVGSFCIYKNDLIHGFVGAENNGSISLSFTEEIDETSFSTDFISMTDKNGTTIAITGYEIDGRNLKLNYTPLTAEGTYSLAISEKVQSVKGHALDQNQNKVGGEEDDIFVLRLTADLTAPKVVKVSPDEDFAGTLTTLQITFSSAIDFDSVSGQISLIGPDGQEIIPTFYKQLTASCIEVTVPEQTAYGQYKIKVGSRICDLARNRLDQNGDGVFGGEDDIFFSTFNITGINLKVSDVGLKKTLFQPGEKASVNWIVHNDGGYELSGSWTDGVYLSTDSRWDINDILLGSLSHDGGLTQNQQLSSSIDVSLAGVPTGTYYLLVRSDIYMQEKGDRESALAAQNLEAVEIRIEIPELTAGQNATIQSIDSGDCSYFHFKQDADTAIILNLSAGGGSNWEIYVAEGFVPTRTQYSQVLRNINNGTINLASGVSAKDIYVMVCAKNVPDGSSFTLSAAIPDMEILEVSSPRQSIQADSFFEVNGMNFTSDAVVSLRASDGTVYTPDATYYINSGKIRFEFIADTLKEDVYDLCIEAGERTVSKDNSITMVAGTGAELTGKLTTPASVGYHVASTLTFNYSNTGFSSMDAPLIILKPALYYETEVKKKCYIDAHGRKREIQDFGMGFSMEDYPTVIALNGNETLAEWRERNSYIVENGSSITVEESPYGESVVGEDASGQVTKTFSISMPASTAASDDAISQGRSKAIAEALTTGKQSLLGETDVSLTNKNVTKLYPGTIFYETSKVVTQKEGAILALDPSIAGNGFWTSNMPEGFSTSVSFLAAGENGILLPGESGSIDIYYNGWQQPWDYSYPPVRWNLSYITTSNTKDIDWNSILANTELPNDLKTILVSNLNTSVGETWGDYVRMLNSNMKYLADIGAENSSDSAELFRFEVMQQTGALSPFRTLQTCSDLLTTAPGLSLEISREYHSDLLSRYQRSSFGYGWTCNWDISLEIESDGDLVLQTSGTRHSYQLSAKSSSAKTVYTTVDGDDGSVMRKTKNGYTLTKRDGTVYAFNTSGQLNSVTDSCGNTIVCYYIDGKLMKLRHSSGQSLTIERNKDGMIAMIKDNAGREVTYSYSNGDLVSAVDALAGTTCAYTYDSTHGMTSAVDAAGQKTDFTYEEATGRLSQISSRDGAQTLSISYGDDGDIYVLDSNGASYAFAYDAQGRIAKTDDKNAEVETFIRYDENGNPITLRNSRKNTLSISFNQYGEITGVTDALENSEKVFYDANGNIIRSIDAYGNTTEYDYDERGCLSAAYYADGNSNLFEYDSFGNLSAFIDVKGNTATFRYNADGLCTEEEFDGSTCSYEYDLQGNLTKTVLADGSTLSFDWNGRGDLVRFVDASGNATTYDYDANGNLTAVQRVDGTSATSTYDQYNDLVNWTSARGTTADYSYNEKGLLTEVALSDGISYAISYDDLDRVVTAGDMAFSYDQYDLLVSVNASGGRNIAYAYDNLERVISISNGMHTTAYSYTSFGDLDRVTTETGALVADYDYNRFGNLAKITRGNGTSVVYSYNEYQELDGITEYDKSGNVVESIRYQYDAESRIVAKADSSGTWSYSYDKAGRLIRAVQTDDAQTVIHSEEYAYDAAGNRLSSVIDGETRLYVYDNMNRIVSCNDFAYRYDADGNLMEDELRTYTWTADNRVASEMLKSTGQVWEYGYDALGNRTRVTTNGVTTTYTLDTNGNVLAEYVDGVFSRSYIQGNLLAAFIDADGNTYYYSSDLLGSTTGITDAAGITVNSYRYDSFGNVLASTEVVANDFEFVGGYGLMANASGTTFVRARNYDPITGRWISEDPIGINGGENLYVYCGNDGINNIDVSGYSDELGRFLNINDLTWWNNEASPITNSRPYEYGNFGQLTSESEELISGCGEITSGKGNFLDLTKRQGNSLSERLERLSGSAGKKEAGNAGKEFAKKLIKEGTKTGAKRAASAVFGEGIAAFALGWTIGRGLVDLLKHFGFDWDEWMSERWNDLFDLFDNGDNIPSDFSGLSNSEDPNDKLGPEGVGENRYVSAQERFEYTVRFENDPEMANSPVKWVRVYDTLDSSFDLDTFELKEFNLAGINFSVGDGRDAWHDKVTVEVNGESVLVDASIGLEWSDELEAWQLVAEFTAIDPETGAMIQDPSSGFLYPNDDTGRGDGHISYSVSLKDGVDNNTQVLNTAEIYFDFNDPIDTPTVMNTVDTVAPGSPELTLTEKNGVVTMTLSAEDMESGIAGYYVKYSLDGISYYEYCVCTVDTLTFNGTLGSSYYFVAQAIDNVGNVSEWSKARSVRISNSPLNNLSGSKAGLTWDPIDGASGYVVEYSLDDFEHFVRFTTESNSLDSFCLPAGNYQWRVRVADADEWVTGDTIAADAETTAPQLIQSDENGKDDLFFASPNGTWSSINYAQHVGSVNDWSGTNELVSANGKGRIQNLYFGSADPNVLCLTDGENGDAIFVDDVYTDLPDSVAEHTARLYKIQEIRAGAGDDIVDMTSQRFEYTGEGLTIRGGAGNDTIWANKGNNMLFGDAGNDRIVGASGNDVIAGGIGNDRMHGGGGSDIFTFGENWGVDTVEQLATGSVTLWFASGDEINWDSTLMTYTDGDNSVKVSGVTTDKITLKFGDDGSAQFASLSGMGAFFDATTERIFEESEKGMLTSL